MASMATKKASGTAKNLTDSNPKYLGVKLYAGERARKGSIIVRQRGTKFIAGKNAALGRDDTVYAVADGTVSFRAVRKTRFDGSIVRRKVVDVKE
jgi:large subunit ribosomal protein L27